MGCRAFYVQEKFLDEQQIKQVNRMVKRIEFGKSYTEICIKAE